MKKVFEYKTVLIKSTDTMTEQLNEKGNEGWELVTVFCENRSKMAVFKKVVEQPLFWTAKRFVLVVFCWWWWTFFMFATIFYKIFEYFILMVLIFKQIAKLK